MLTHEVWPSNQGAWPSALSSEPNRKKPGFHRKLHQAYDRIVMGDTDDLGALLTQCARFS
jgi:hypothetical protein